MDEAQQDAVRAVLLKLSRDGSPVVRPETIEQTMAIGWRRWRSFERRNARSVGSADARVEDLAKGLRDALESEPQLAGPLMEDYRFLARALAPEFTRGM